MKNLTSFDLQFDLQGQMPFCQPRDSESLDHSDTFWHGCQLWKNAIKSFFRVPWPADYLELFCIELVIKVDGHYFQDVMLKQNAANRASNWQINVCISFRRTMFSSATIQTEMREFTNVCFRDCTFYLQNFMHIVEAKQTYFRFCKFPHLKSSYPPRIWLFSSCQINFSSVWQIWIPIWSMFDIRFIFTPAWSLSNCIWLGK